MASSLRRVSICVAVGLCGAVSPGHSETVDTLRPTVAPSLTITSEVEQVPLKNLKRIADPNAALGVKLGGIILYPSLEAGTLYTSNVANASTEAQSDIGLYLRPSLRFESACLHPA